MELNYATYSLGATVMCKKVISRVKRHEDDIRKYLGLSTASKLEYHAALLPPFKTDLITASKINIGCAMARLLSNHPLANTLFSITQLEVMSHNGVDHLHFPLQIERGALPDHAFINYIQDLSKKLNCLGVNFQNPISDARTPNISVYSGENLRENNGIRITMKESCLHSPIPFRFGHPILYTEYPEVGWVNLTRSLNPSE